MKNLVNKGFKYFVAIMMVFSLMSMNAWANGPKSGTSSETGSTTTENKGTTKDTGDSQGDTADQLISNEEKKTTTSKESDDKEGQTDQTTDKKTDYTYEDKKISVKAVLANASAISDQAELRVKEIPESTTEYKKYQEALNKKSNLYSNVLLYDISFILDGKEVEPTDGNVKVSMSFKDQQLSDDLNVKDNNDLKVIHFKDNDVNKQESLKTTTSVKNETTSFETKSFSAYAVVTENGTTKNVYPVNGFQIPDYGYGVTAEDYYQAGDTETNIYVDHYTANAKELGASGNYSNAGGYDYIGSIESMSNEGLYFYQRPVKLYLGENAYSIYTNNKSKFNAKEGQLQDEIVEKNTSMSAKTQIEKMASAYSSRLSEIKFKDVDTITSNSFTVDLRNLPSGTYAVKFSGNHIDPQSKIFINEGQHLIFYCTTAGNFESDRYKIAALNTGQNENERKEVESTEYVASKNSTDDWKTEAVSFYMPDVTELHFPAGTCGVFVAPKASMTKGSTCGGVIGVKSFGTSTSYANGEWHYHNHDLPSPDSIELKVKKTFKNDIWPEGTNTYKVKLEKLDENEDTPIPTSNELNLSKSNSTGKFGKITYQPNQGKKNQEVIYKYKLTEVNNGQANVTFDDTIYYINVKLKYSDNGSANVVNITYTTNKNSENILFDDNDDNNYFVFTNSYNTFSAKASLKIKKTVNGSAPGDKQFKFNLDEGSLDSKGEFIKSKNVQENATNDINGNVTFNELNYTEVGTHYYRIYETATTVDPAKNYVASGDIYAKVVIDQNSKAVITYYSDPQFSKEVMDPTINNQEKTYFQIRKYDADNQNKYLGGAVFELYKVKNIKNGQLIIDSYEDVKRNTSSTIEKYIGKTLFYDLLYGNTYVLKEVQAPDGYQISGPWLLEITDEGHMTLTKLTEYKEVNGKENTFNYVKSTNSNDIKEQEAKVILNKPIGIGDKKIEYTLPSTGGIGTKKYYLLGTLLSMLGVIYIVMKLGKGGLFRKEDHS